MNRERFGVLEVRYSAKPEKKMIDPNKTAVLVIDMQNEFCSEGGETTQYGFNVHETTRKPIKPIQDVLEVARAAGIKVVFTKAGHRIGLADAPKYLVENHAKKGVVLGSDGPHGGKSHIRDTWNTNIIDELKPRPTDIVVYGSGYNKFYQNELDLMLRNLGIDTLIFTGVTTNCCVSSTLRDAADRGYVCVVLSDCVAAFSQKAQESELLTMEHIFASISDSKKFIDAFKSLK